MLYIDMIDKRIAGCCKVSDIKMYGLVGASMLEDKNEIR